MQMITDPQKQGAAAAMMARVMWPKIEWAPEIFHPFHSLDGCHDAAMWLRDNHFTIYELYVESIEDCKAGVFSIDAPSPVRASALAIAFEGIGGE